MKVRKTITTYTHTEGYSHLHTSTHMRERVKKHTSNPDTHTYIYVSIWMRITTMSMHTSQSVSEPIINKIPSREMETEIQFTYTYPHPHKCTLIERIWQASFVLSFLGLLYFPLYASLPLAVVILASKKKK